MSDAAIVPPAPAPAGGEEHFMPITEEFGKHVAAIDEQESRFRALAQLQSSDELRQLYFELAGMSASARAVAQSTGMTLDYLESRVDELEEEGGAAEGGDHGRSQLTDTDATLFRLCLEQTTRFLADLLSTMPTDSSSAVEQRLILEKLLSVSQDRLARVNEIALSPEDSEEDEPEDDDPEAEEDDEPEDDDEK